MMKDWKKYLAEMLGTKFLVLIGLGAIVLPVALMGESNNVFGSFGMIFFPFAFGLALAAIIYTIGPISGGHVNPAVSLGFALRKKLSWKDFAFYVVAQVIGAIIGAAILFGLFKLMTGGGTFRFGDTYSDIGPRMINGLFAALIINILLTYIFVLAWMGIVRKTENKTVAGIIIGLFLAAVLITTAVVNPAISLSAAIFSGRLALEQVWLFIVAPLLGGAWAALTAWCLFKGENRPEVGTKEAPKIADVNPQASAEKSQVLNTKHQTSQK